MDNFKVLINADKLARKLAPLVSIADAKTPILAQRLIKVVVKNSAMSLTASNAQTCVTCKIKPTEIDGECEFLIEGKKLHALLSKLGAAPLEITNSPNAENALNISWCKGVYQIAVVSANNYPQLPQSAKLPDTELSLPVATFLDAISKVKYAAAKSDFRPQLNGVYISGQDNKLKVCATDTRIAARYLTEVEFLCPAKTEYLIDVQQLNELTAVIKSFDDIEILSIQQREDAKAEISLISDNQCVVAKFCVSQIEGKYPDVDRVFPQTSSISTTASASEWKAIIPRLVSISQADAPIICLTISETENKLSLRDTDAQTLGAEKLNECSSDGYITIGFSSSVLLNVLSGVSDNLNIYLNDASRPMLIKPAEKAEYNLDILVMPVLLS